MRKPWGAKKAGDVMCPLFLHSCVARAFTHAEVVGALSARAQGAYMAAYEQQVEQRGVAQHEAARAEAAQAEEVRRARLTAEERAADDCKRHVAEEILTLKCPRCAQVRRFRASKAPHAKPGHDRRLSQFNVAKTVMGSTW
jgi:hypothetical protein